MGNPLKRVEQFYLMLLLLDEKRHTLERWNDKAPLRETRLASAIREAPMWVIAFDVFAMRNFPLRLLSCRMSC